MQPIHATHARHAGNTIDARHCIQMIVDSIHTVDIVRHVVYPADRIQGGDVGKVGKVVGVVDVGHHVLNGIQTG